MKYFSKKFKEKVVEESDDKNITLQEVADKYKVSLASVQRWRYQKKHFFLKDSSQGSKAYRNVIQKDSIIASLCKRVYALETDLLERGLDRDNAISKAISQIESVATYTKILIDEMRIDQEKNKNGKR